jgi:alpha-glucosidase
MKSNPTTPRLHSLVALSILSIAGPARAEENVPLPNDPAPSAPQTNTPIPVSERIHESLSGMAIRFHASPEAMRDAHPSYALTQEVEQGPKGKVELRNGTPVPTFSIVDGKQRATIKIPPGTSLYGTGEAAGPLLRNGRVVTAWNTDAYGYDDTAPSLYKSHPWVLAVRPDGSAFGVLADTTYRCEVDTAAAASDEIRFTADGPAFPVIVIEGGSPLEVVQKLTKLTGLPPLPAKWTLGYHQCRYSYYPEARVREIAEGFRSRKIPCDVIWYDIDYYESFRCFTFDRGYFPDPKKLNADLAKIGFHNVWMINPGIKSREEPSPADPPASARASEPAELKAAREKELTRFRTIRDSGLKGGHYVQRADGSVYEGEVWPGWCYFPDFTRPSVNAWWGPWYKDFMAMGVTGVWNDMNEPAIFNVKSKTMPEDNIHLGDPGLVGPSGTPQGPEKAKGDHARYHNVFGMMMVKGTRDGIQAANPDSRPFVLSRATYIGGQRFHAGWSGDNTANWYHLEASIPMVLNMGLSGFSFYGPDIGGFAANGDGDLFQRWIGFGTLLPFCRSHTGKGNIDKEPWAFGPQVEHTSRLAIERRMRLMPYIYTLFHENSTLGSPVCRPAFFADPADQALRSEDDCFLLGGDLLVVAQTVPDRSRVPVLPRSSKGNWAEVAFPLSQASIGDRVFIEAPMDNQTPELPRLYLRPGAIIPTGPVMQFVGEKTSDPLTLLVNLDDAGSAAGTLYEDQGDGYAYRDKDDYRLTTFSASRAGDTVTISSDAVGKRAGISRTIEVRLLHAGKEVTATFKAGQPMTIRLNN